MIDQKVKFTIPHIDNKINVDNVNNELEKIFPLSNNMQKNIMTSTLQIGNRGMVKGRKWNKLTPIFEPTPHIVIETKGTLIKAKEKNRNHIVTRNISVFYNSKKCCLSK